MGKRHIIENAPAQRDSGMSKLADGTMGLMGVIGVMRLMGGKPEMKNCPAQRGSENSKLDFPLCLCALWLRMFNGTPETLFSDRWVEV
jgi:hypothetical protein